MTHQEQLLEWFQHTKTVTSYDAFRHMQNTRLADTVHNLRKKGHVISTETLKSSRGTYARYHYHGLQSEAA